MVVALAEDVVGLRTQISPPLDEDTLKNFVAWKLLLVSDKGILFLVWVCAMVHLEKHLHYFN